MKISTPTAVMSNDKSARQAGDKSGSSGDKRSFLQRYRLPLFLALVAVCLYVGSILYILYGRGQV